MSLRLYGKMNKVYALSSPFLLKIYNVSGIFHLTMYLVSLPVPYLENFLTLFRRTILLGGSTIVYFTSHLLVSTRYM